MNLFCKALVVSAFLATALVQAAPEEWARMFENMYGTPEKLNAAVVKIYGPGLSPQKMTIARSNMNAVLFHPSMPAYFDKLVAPLLRGKLSEREVTAAMGEVMVQVQAKGLARLSAERQAAFVAHMINMSRWLSPRDCKALFLGQMSTTQSAALELRYTAALPADRFEAISSLYRAAVEAEITGYPDTRSINAQQAAVSERLFNDAAAKRVNARIPTEVSKRVKLDVASAPPAEVCATMTVSLEAMFDLSEPYKAWQLIRFVQAMQ